jgi:hypothetical protein
VEIAGRSYEPPRIERVGTIAELTGGPILSGVSLKGLQKNGVAEPTSSST